MPNTQPIYIAHTSISNVDPNHTQIVWDHDGCISNFEGFQQYRCEAHVKYTSNAVMHETLQCNMTFIYIPDSRGGENNSTPLRKSDVAVWKLNIRSELDMKPFRFQFT